MKILHVITGLSNGGAEAVLFRLVADDQGSGNQHTVISLMDRGIYAARLEQAGCAVYCLNMARGRFSARGAIQLYRRMKALQPDVVQTWMYHANLMAGVAARLMGVRAIVWGVRQSNLDRDKNSRMTLFVIRLSALMSRFIPARIVCCSEHAVQLHRRAGFCARKMVTIPNGFDLKALPFSAGVRIKAREALQIDGRQPVIGMIARFDPLKDHSNLLAALATLKQRRYPFICLLVGPDMTPDNTALVALLARTGLNGNVRLLGPRHDVPALMNALDLHVLSSAGESFPNVLAEAMACGTPCVTTDVGDAAAIVGDLGWVVPARCPPALANAILSALEERHREPSRWQRRQADGRSRIAARFSLGQMAAAYHTVWDSLHPN